MQGKLGVCKFNSISLKLCDVSTAVLLSLENFNTVDQNVLTLWVKQLLTSSPFF